MGMEGVRQRMKTEYHICYLCDDVLDWAAGQIVFDHKIATVHGGRTVPENVRPVHLLCNAAKGSKLFDPRQLAQ